MTAIATTSDNPRGYAFRSLSNAWYRQLGWRAYAAAQKYGYYPSLNEYIEQGLDMFDPMYTVATQDMDTANAIISKIIVEMGRSIKATMYGHITEHQDDKGFPAYQPRHDIRLDEPVHTYGEEVSTKGLNVPEIEQGYDDVDDADLMRMRMRIISKRINAEDLAVLQSLVIGEHDTISSAFNSNYVKAMLFRRRMSAQLGSLEGSLVFG